MSETLRLAAAVVATVALLAVCTQGPLLLARHVHPSVGALAAVAAGLLWLIVVRPMPGFIQGIVCLGGLAAIAGVLLGCLALLAGSASAEPAAAAGRMTL